jgi:glycosyltransferase involved in cell wall biosynthesis
MYIALSHFSRRKFIEGGLPADRIVVKPNFLNADPGLGDHAGEFALFVGRLSPEKGVRTLIGAWQQSRRMLPLKVVGDGPLQGTIDQSPPNVEWLGRLPKDRVISLMKQAAFLILPSIVYENFPVTVLEAFATGLPVVASGHGALAEIVRDGQTGRLFRAGDSADLASTVEWVVDHRGEMAAMGRRARVDFEANYTEERNYDILMRLYRGVCDSANKREGDG